MTSLRTAPAVLPQDLWSDGLRDVQLSGTQAVIRFLLDTNAAIFAMIDAAGPVNRRIGAHAPGELAISAIRFLYFLPM